MFSSSRVGLTYIHLSTQSQVGPRVEFFEGSVFEDEELVRILPFLALPDGAHLVCMNDYYRCHKVTCVAEQ